MRDEWTCFARPALTENTCFASNFGGYYCKHCGATRRAGELRKEKGDVDLIKADSKNTKRDAISH